MLITGLGIGISFPSAPHNAGVCGRIRLPGGGLLPQLGIRLTPKCSHKGCYGKYCAPLAQSARLGKYTDRERRLVRAQAMSGTAS